MIYEQMVHQVHHFPLFPLLIPVEWCIRCTMLAVSAGLLIRMAVFALPLAVPLYGGLFLKRAYLLRSALPNTGSAEYMSAA